jgi:hypothetical protein
VSGIAGRSTVRAVTIPLPMRAMAMPVAVETISTGEPAGISVTRPTDPARMRPTNARSALHAHSQATSAAMRGRGVQCRGAGDNPKGAALYELRCSGCHRENLRNVSGGWSFDLRSLRPDEHDRLWAQ